MLVDVARHPAAAMWQGVMLILICMWVVWYTYEDRSKRVFLISIAVMVAFGIVLAAVLIYWMG
jgi:hypothetical protein